MQTSWSEILQQALEREVVGQQRAVRSIIRAVVRGTAGLTDHERPRGVFLFMGPTGTGKTHLTRVLAGLLHGERPGLASLDCTQVGPGQGAAALRQAALALAHGPRPSSPWAPVFDTIPNALLVIDRPEEGPGDLSAAIATVLDRGHVALEGAARLSLSGALIFLTSGLCTREIFDLSSSGIGFHSSVGEGNDEVDQKIFDLCRRAAEAFWDPSFLGRLDGVVVFNRLQEQHLPQILDRRLRGLAADLARGGVVLLVEESARRFLILKGMSDLRYGARQLDRSLRRFLEHPLADLILSGQLAAGCLARVEAKANDLEIDVAPLVPWARAATLAAPARFTDPCGNPWITPRSAATGHAR